MSNPIKYDFKHLDYNGEFVHLPKGSIYDFYISQDCNNCNYRCKGYYSNLRKIQNFKCPKCYSEWAIACIDEKNKKADKVEDILFAIDGLLEQLERIKLV